MEAVAWFALAVNVVALAATLGTFLAAVAHFGWGPTNQVLVSVAVELVKARRTP